MPQYADIALPVSVDKVFTYLIPQELTSSALIGTRAIVPFGSTYSTGLIVGLPTATDIRSLKSIRDIVDATPVVSDELLRLCKWVAEYYVAPLGEVLRTAMPHGFSGSTKRMAHHVRSPSTEERARLERTAPKRAALLALLEAKGTLSAAELQTKTGFKSIHAVLNDLVREGVVRTEEIYRATASGPVLRTYIDLTTLDPGRLAAEIAATPPRQKRVRRFLETLHALQESGTREIAAPDFLKKSGGSMALLRKYAIMELFSIQRREIHAHQDLGTDDSTLSHVLNADQRAVLSAVKSAMNGGTHRTFLLHGVTGSGKTQVYIEAIRGCLALGKTAIVLVPEISLTPQIVRRFRSHFGDQAAVVHSRMSVGERLAVWRRALTGNCRIVIGPRSAVFAPLQRTGLIVVDEEHEASYKQFDSNPRYNARDVAIVRGSYQNAVVLLGSATPSVESAYNARSGKFELLSMPRRIDGVPMPAITIVDMTSERRKDYAALKESLPEDRRKELKIFRQSAISSPLQAAIDDRLGRHEGVILLQNRRGFAPFVECADCGHTEMCDRCSVTMTYHLASRHLRCHYCGSVRAPLTECPQCHGASLELRGVGTQRVEQELARLFPGAKVLRMDLDTTTRKGSHDRILQAFGEGRADILLGTQMVAKGLDFARVTLVGVISADTQLLLPDFRASERTYQLLTQVAGRAGRSTLRGTVIIQSHQANNGTLRHVVSHDYWTFYEEEVKARMELDYPPFSRMALVEVRGKAEEKVRGAAEQFAALIRRSPGGMTILGPSPAVISRIKEDYRWHLILKSPIQDGSSASRLRQAVGGATKEYGKGKWGDVRLIIDVDPVGML